jgi:ATP-binding cassette subfamily G (WHITE) protein 2 (PDR)
MSNIPNNFDSRQNSPYTTSFAYQVRICIKRNIHRICNSLDVSISAIVGNIIMGIIIGSMFYNLDSTTSSFYNRSVLLFFAILLNAFMSSFEVSAHSVKQP